MPLRVVLVGAGSHVFGLSMLSQFLLENDFPELELVLVDPDETAGRRMEKVANRLRPDCAIWSPAANDALSGADYVICAAAVQLHRRFERDKEIIQRLAPDHLLTEFGGVYGAASTMRQLKLVEDLCSTMRAHCPHAKLFMISNPMPRLVTAANLWSIETVGFCSVSLLAYNVVAKLLGEEEEQYPFARLREKYRLTSVGTNHLAWLVGARVQATGEDVIPLLRKAWETTSEVTKSIKVAREVGALPVSGDDHIQDFLPPVGLEHPLEHISHGSAEDRERLNDLLDAYADGRSSWEEIVVPPSWERPGDVIRALCGGPTVLISSLNLPNRGQIPSVRSGAVVETPVSITAAGMRPLPTSLPPAAAIWARSCISVTEALLAAYHGKSLHELKRALYIDPTATDFVAAWAALDKIVKLDEDLIGKFS